MAHTLTTRPFVSLVSGTTRRRSVRDFMALSRQRRQLAKLDARMLADVGIVKASAKAEATRPVWDVPAHWRA